MDDFKEQALVPAQPLPKDASLFALFHKLDSQPLVSKANGFLQTGRRSPEWGVSLSAGVFGEQK